MLFGWMKSLIIYLIFAGAVINMTPAGSYKKYIKFFTGIVAIIILMKPISFIFDFDENKLYGIVNQIELYTNEDKLNDNQLTDYYDLSLAEAIKLELIDRGFSVEQVSVITDKDDKLLSCVVYVNKKSQLDMEFESNNIKKILFQVYNLDNHNINVVRR